MTAMADESDLPVLAQMRRCMVRQLLAWRLERGDDWREQFVAGWAKWPSLKPDVQAQWKAGNRGQPGDWR